MKKHFVINKRSLVKAITWETGSFVLLMILSKLFFGDFKITMLAIVYVIIKIPLLYWHEMMWKKTGWLK